MFQVFKILVDKDMRNLIIFCDPMIIVQAFVSYKTLTILNLDRIYVRVKKILDSLGNYHFFHVLQEKNTEDDFQENVASTLPEGILKVDNELEKIAMIP